MATILATLGLGLVAMTAYGLLYAILLILAVDVELLILSLISDRWFR